MCIITENTNEVIRMDMKLMRKLDKQGFIIVALHTVVWINLAVEFIVLT